MITDIQGNFLLTYFLEIIDFNECGNAVIRPYIGLAKKDYCDKILKLFIF